MTSGRKKKNQKWFFQHGRTAWNKGKVTDKNVYDGVDLTATKRVRLPQDMYSSVMDSVVETQTIFPAGVTLRPQAEHETQKVVNENKSEYATGCRIFDVDILLENLSHY